MAVLCVTEIVSWGVLFYAFPVLGSSISIGSGGAGSILVSGQARIPTRI